MQSGFAQDCQKRKQQRIQHEGLQEVLRGYGVFITHTFVWINGSIVIPSRPNETSQIDQVGAGAVLHPGLSLG